MKIFYKLFFLSCFLFYYPTISFAQVGVEDIKICVISDLHYFDTSLLIVDGPAFEDYLHYDRKLLRECFAITESLMDSIISEQPDIVLASGDLTKDGELVCHQKMAAYFGQLEANGAKVIVCPGNHDINNPHAVAFDYDTTYQVPSVNPQEFSSIYGDFGFNEAIAVDTASLSYIIEPVQGLQILSIDVCRYDSNYIDNYPQTSGGFKPQVLQWAKDRIIDARSAGKIIMAIQHHNMIEHFTNQQEIFGEYVIDDWESEYSELADLGLKVIFTGHFHAHDTRNITTAAGNIFYGVETGSTVTWPCPYRILTLGTDTVLNITGKKVENINYDTGSLTFQEYGLQDLEEGLPATIIYYLTQPPQNVDQGTAEFVEPAFTETLIAHYAGNEGSPSFNTSFTIWTLYLTGYDDIAEALESVWDDYAPDDWNTSIDLRNYDEQIVLDLKVFLEGPFNTSDMNNSLNQDYLPVEQPYNGLPYMYTGIQNVQNIPDSDIVDWLIVEARDANEAINATSDTKVGRQIAFLLKDGSVVGMDGSNNISIVSSSSITNNLFVVTNHRNHLSVLSANPLIEANGVYSYDFTSGSEQAFGDFAAQKEIATGIWGMMAGDGNSDGIVDISDKLNFWSLLAGRKGYLQGDYNLDADINNQDKNDFWRSNMDSETQIPD